MPGGRRSGLAGAWRAAVAGSGSGAEPAGASGPSSVSGSGRRVRRVRRVGQAPVDLVLGSLGQGSGVWLVPLDADRLADWREREAMRVLTDGCGPPAIGS